MTHDRTALYIGGEWAGPATDASIPVENPATERVFATVPDGSPQDVDRAVAAARGAFDAWSATSRAERAGHLRCLHRALPGRKDALADTIVAEVGAPHRIATRSQTDLPLDILEHFIELLEEYEPEERIGPSLIVGEPAGVVAAITSWNYPLHQIVAKAAAALAAGCTVVLKPSELTPLSAYAFFDALHEAGLPAGVANLVPGAGPAAGHALAAHRDVDMVSFTGSTATGAAAAGTAKKTVLGLGGKSTGVLLDDADLGRAVRQEVGNAFLNSGQLSTVCTRMLVEESRYEEAVKLAAESAAWVRPGDPRDPTARFGPLVSAAQRERVRDLIRTAVLEEGARLVCGGVEVPDGFETGYYVWPTVLADVAPDSAVAREEVFGPVVSITRCSGEGDALRIANSSRYGLAGTVWSADPDRALAFARRMRVGSVQVNGGILYERAPFGGRKQSGVGRELGRYGIEEFREVKSIHMHK